MAWLVVYEEGALDEWTSSLVCQGRKQAVLGLDGYLIHYAF